MGRRAIFRLVLVGSLLLGLFVLLAGTGSRELGFERPKAEAVQLTEAGAGSGKLQRMAPVAEPRSPTVPAPQRPQRQQVQSSPVAEASFGPGSALPPAIDPEPLELVGVLSGLLIPESGVFDQDARTLLQGLTLDAVSRAQPRITVEAQLRPVLDEEGRLVAVAFETERLPALEFELTLSQLRPRRWDRTSAMALPPQGGIEFLCYDRDDEVAVKFVVEDALTGERVAAWTASQFRLSASRESGVLLHAGPLNADKVPMDAALQWIVEAEGYAPAFGNERDFSISPDGAEKTVTVRLERGFATRLVVLGLSPDRVPAGRATVWLDGRRVGATDDSGQILLHAAEKPQAIEVRWHGQALKGAFDRVCLARRSHLHVALLEAP